MRRGVIIAVATVVAVAITVGVAFVVSPWPGVLLLRASPELSSSGTSDQFVPDDIASDLDRQVGDSDLTYDVFRPDDADTALPAVVWVHGGAFVAGSKDAMRDYLRLVASHGFTVVSVEYTHAPEATYPTQVEEVDHAIEAALRDADELLIDPERIVLAGDSAGAHIAAQLAMVATDSTYAASAGLSTILEPAQVVSTVQFSGPYDIFAANYDNPTFGFFMRTVMWSYSGTRDFLDDPTFAFTALPRYVSSSYPPTFLSTGPADPLLEQGQEWQRALESAGVEVDALLFDPATTSTSISHEYQLDVTTAEGKRGMVSMVAFLRETTRADFRAGVSDGW